MKKSFFDKLDEFAKKNPNAADAMTAVILFAFGAAMIWLSAWLRNN